MKIDGKVFCFFEQSGTFKNEFRNLGIPAEDYDIQNHFAQTDHVCDLFAEIETAYRGGAKCVRRNHSRRSNFGVLSLYIFLRSQPNELFVGMCKLPQYDNKAKNGHNTRT